MHQIKGTPFFEHDCNYYNAIHIVRIQHVKNSENDNKVFFWLSNTEDEFELCLTKEEMDDFVDIIRNVYDHLS